MAISWKVVWESLFNKVTLEQKFKGDEKMNHMAIQ